jgi:hypothetical protein
MKIINLTPHALTVYSENGALLGIFESNGIIRLATRKVKIGEADGIPLFSTEFGDPEGLPEKLDRQAIYIVSALAKKATALAFAENYDEEEGEGLPRVASPGELVRNEKGEVIGCKGFDI